MSAYIIWWILAFTLIALELTTGTFYLLIYGVAAAAAGIAAWLDSSLVAQLVTAAIIGITGTLALRKGRRAESTDEALQELDIGQPVVLESWKDGRGQVKYRGAIWNAEAKDDTVDCAKPLYIRAVRGTVLIVSN